MHALAEPGIDIRKLKPGTTILLEADPYLYEIKVMHPVHGIVEISSSDPATAGGDRGPGAPQRPLVESGSADSRLDRQGPGLGDPLPQRHCTARSR